jgi:STIP1 family protein 1
MKAYFQLAQAQIALYDAESALNSAKEAHRLCVEEIAVGGKGGTSIGPITELVLRCKKEDWERREGERLRARGGLLEGLVGFLEKEGREGEVEELRRVFEEGGRGGEARRRKVPDWCVDDITFSVMLDPVVVSLYPPSFPLLISFSLLPSTLPLFLS